MPPERAPTWDEKKSEIEKAIKDVQDAQKKLQDAVNKLMEVQKTKPGNGSDNRGTVHP